MIDPSTPVTVRMGKVVADENQRTLVFVSFFIKDDKGYTQTAEVSMDFDEDYKLSELRPEAIRRGRELLAQLASHPLDASPRPPLE